jgi:uncharacterized protein involved in exopolysaccharide biosynthesis
VENNFTELQQEESFDYKALFFKLYRYWYFFILTIFIALLIAFLFNKYTKPIYEVKTTVLINDTKGGEMDAQALMGFGFVNSQQNVENEIGKLQSYSLVNEVVRDLDLYISYFREENFITKELYKDNPFTIVFDSAHLQPINLKFKLTILNNKTYTLEAEGKNIKLYNYKKYEVFKSPGKEDEVNILIDSTFAFGQRIISKNFNFKVELTESYNPETDGDVSFFFIFNNPDKLTKQFQSFEIEPIKEESSILKITLKGNNVNKSIDFLNKLTEVYLSRNLEKKNRAAENTVSFINSQLGVISDSLNNAEQTLQDFRTDNKVMDLDFQATQVFEQLKDLESEKAMLTLKNKYYLTLKEYIEKNKGLEDVLIIPSSLGIDDPLLNELTTQLTDAYSEKQEKLLYSTNKNPAVIMLNQKIEMIEATLLENLKNILKNSQIAINDINNRINDLESKVKNLPSTQRQLLGIERKFKLSDNLYNYLMEKRSEAQITKASNEPDNEIIDIARDAGDDPVFPKKSLNFVIAIILGIVLPVVYILGKDYFNDSIVERKDVENITSYPIVGHIIHSNRDTQAVLPNRQNHLLRSHSVQSEQICSF